MEDTPEVPGVLYQEKTHSNLPINETAAHLIGYVEKRTAEDIKKNPTIQAVTLLGKPVWGNYLMKKD